MRKALTQLLRNLNRLNASSVGTPQRRSALRRSMQMESLEARNLFAVSVGTANFATYDVADVLRIQGTEENDKVEVAWLQNNAFTVFDDQVAVYDQSGLVGKYDIYNEALGGGTHAQNFVGIQFLGGNGNDSFKFKGGISPQYVIQNSDPNSASNEMFAAVDGGEGDDHIVGSNANDWLVGGKGNDTIIGRGSGESTYGIKLNGSPNAFHGDHIFGNEGNDTIFGDYLDPDALNDDGSAFLYRYDDRIDAGEGNDIVYSGLSDTYHEKEGELVIGGLGDDQLFSDDGAYIFGDLSTQQANLRPDLALKGGKDYLWGEGTLVGGGGDDTIHARNGSDIIYGDSTNPNSPFEVGNDTIYADPFVANAVKFHEGGKDLIYGGRGNDKIVGGGNVDTIFGGAGNDSIWGGTDLPNHAPNDGGDIIHGDADDDGIYGGLGNDMLYGDGGVDSLYGELGNDTLEGGSMNDLLVGGAGWDGLYGNAGDDVLQGGDDADFLSGGGGNDTLWGGSGNDSLYGDKGNDKLYGMSGDDTLKGGDDNDELFGGSENDKLFGEAGTDKLFGESGDDELDGGIGAMDYLSGGIGKDKFKKDLFMYGLNADAPVDFNSADDQLV